MAVIENNKYNKYIYIILAPLFCFGSLFISKSFVFASGVDHIVISEIQAGTSKNDSKDEVGTSENGPEDEFVELYNPTDQVIDLSGWELRKRSSSDSEDNLVDNKKFSGLIVPGGFFLIAHINYKGPVKADLVYSANSNNLAYKNNSVVLYNISGVVDEIRWIEIPKSQSIERKALQNGICVSAQSSGEFLGNGCDAAGDVSDFEIRGTPNPQNSGSPKEPPENESPKNELPVVKILSPENDAVYTEGEIINFKVEASDLEDGAVKSEDIIWKEGDAELGKGNEMEIKNLAVGSHTITLEVQDSGRGKTTKEITIRIISAQNAEDSGEENEVSDGQNNSNQESNQESGISESQSGSNQENAAASAGGGQSGSSSASSAAPVILPKIIITEFLPNPEDSDRDSEFVEIYNSDSAEVDLSKWTMEDKIGQTKKFAIAEGVKIKPGKHRVFYSDETRIALNNSGDGVVLRDNKGNIISETPICDSALDEQSYALGENGKWVFTLRPTPGRKNIIKTEGKSVEEKDDNKKQVGSTALRDYGASGESEEKPDEKNSQIPELNSRQALKQSLSRTCFGIQDDNNKEERYNFSDKIIISEIYPNPKGRDNVEGNYEWIELYNDSDEDVNLRGWQIDDILGKGSKPYIINNDAEIKAKSYLAFSNTDTKLMLNNLGDEVNILWQDETVVDSVKYGNAAEGLSYNLSGDGSWVWSLETTAGRENVIKTETANENSSEISPALNSGATIGKIEKEFEENETDSGINYIETTASEAKKLPRHTLIKIAGTISTPPGVFSDQTFYLSGSGIQVYSYEAEISKLGLGDEVELKGRVSEIGGEARILLDKTEDIKIVSRDNLVEPKIISTGNIGESNEGYLATVEGKVTQMESDTFFVNDGNGEVKVYIKPQTGILEPNIRKGDWLVITGQVSQTSAGYRILPRFQGDIKLGKISGISTAEAASSDVRENSKEKENKISVFSVLFVVMGMLILINWGRISRRMADRNGK